jgi:hypothetical protein
MKLMSHGDIFAHGLFVNPNPPETLHAAHIYAPPTLRPLIAGTRSYHKTHFGNLQFFIVYNTKQ